MSRVKVSVDKESSLKAEIEVAGQTLVIDESDKEIAGPDPYDYILSAIGSCAAITLHMYAKHKQWPLDRVEIKLKHERKHADDCEHCELDEARLTQVVKHVKLYGDLDEKQRQRLKQISDRCPVQKTLVAGITVKSILEH
ncbi:OsmC family protein [Pontibacter ruber]|uniref:OsmC family protein n=1 Tax=Pontibacter ruber TaxID=1343895 RepID=A0ABW5CUJ4_9BACT|nr:OsmC family protein [Pontibacter ruber]